MDDLLNPITGLTCQERKKVMAWVASLPEQQIVKIFQEEIQKYFKLKNDYPTLPEKTRIYCAFILASRKLGWDTKSGKGYRIAGDEQFDDFSNLRDSKVAASTQRGRTPVIRRKVLAYWGEVKELKSKGHGFRPIAAYLKKDHKISICPTYLQKLWNEVEV